MYYNPELSKKVISKFSDVTEAAPKERFVRDPESQIIVPAGKLPSGKSKTTFDPYKISGSQEDYSKWRKQRIKNKQ